MSSGLLLTNAPVVECNGTYNAVGAGTGLNRIFWSSDRLYAILYFLDNVNPTYYYTRTNDASAQAGKKYYYEDQYGNPVEAVIEAGTPLPTDNKYFERSDSTGWVVRRIADPSGNASQSSTYGEILYTAFTTNSASAPFDVDLQWYDKANNAVPLSITFWNESSIVTEVSDPIVDEAAGTTTTITTVTNLVTGDVYRETNVVRNKTVYDVAEITRYDNINLTLGKVYRFQFVSDFQKIGYIPGEDQPDSAGIFRVDKLMSYSDMLASGLDLYASLYLPCGVPKEVFEADKNRIVDTTIYRLVDPTDPSIVYFVPQTFIEGTPDGSVDQYDKVLLTIDLGVHNDPELINDIIPTISKVFEKMWGISAPKDEDGNYTGSIVTMATYDYIWLTKNQKDIIDTARETLKQESTVDLSTVLKLRETNQIYLENRRLKGQVGALEEVVRHLNGNK